MTEPEVPELFCEVCGDEPAVGVASVPGVPYSAPYGRRCLNANAHPIGILIGNTACCGGLDKTAEWWRDMVECTLRHLNKNDAWFAAEVAQLMAEMARPDIEEE